MNQCIDFWKPITPSVVEFRNKFARTQPQGIVDSRVNYCYKLPTSKQSVVVCEVLLADAEMKSTNLFTFSIESYGRPVLWNPRHNPKAPHGGDF